MASDFLDIDDLKSELGCGRRRAYRVAREVGGFAGNKLYVACSALEQHLHPAGPVSGSFKTIEVSNDLVPHLLAFAQRERWKVRKER